MTPNLPPFLLAAADWFEIVAALIFLLVSGLAQLLQKRARGKSAIPEVDGFPRDAEPYDASAPPVRRPAETMEDAWPPDIRRLFEEARREAEPPPPVLVPPPLQQPRSLEPEPEVESLESRPSWEERQEPSREAASLEESLATGGSELAAATRLNTASRLAAAANAYRHASNLQQIVTARLREARSRSHGSRAQRDPKTINYRSAARRVFASPASARQAIIAVTILQPPKSLE